GSSGVHPPAGDESVLDSAIALLDDLLAAGVTPDALDLSALPEGLRAGLADRLSCLLKLRACASPTRDTPMADSASGDGAGELESGVPGQFGRVTIRRELGPGGFWVRSLSPRPRRPS